MADHHDTWRVPLRYTPEELAAFLDALREGRYDRLVFAERDSGEDSYVLTLGRGRALRFNGWRLVDSPQHAHDVAAILQTWADVMTQQNGDMP